MLENAMKALNDAMLFVEKRPGVFSESKEVLLRRTGAPPGSEGVTPWREVAENIIRPFLASLSDVPSKVEKAAWAAAEECAQQREFASVMAEAHDVAMRAVAGDRGISDSRRQKLYSEMNDLVENRIAEFYRKASDALDALAAKLADPGPKRPRGADAVAELAADRRIEIAAEKFLFDIGDAKINAYNKAEQLVEVEIGLGNAERLEGLRRALERFAHSEKGQGTMVSRSDAPALLLRCREKLARALDPETAEERRDREMRLGLQPILGIIDKRLRVPIGMILYRRFRKEPAPGWCSALGLPPPAQAPMAMPEGLGFDNSGRVS